MDLKHMIDTVNILNIDNELSTINATEVIRNNSNEGNLNITNKEYILSDADEELLVLIKFKQIVSLKSIKIYASNDIDIDEDVSPPKHVNIYKLKHLDLDFDDFDSINPDKSINCEIKKLSKGELIKLESKSKMAMTFSKIQYLAIYIKSNQKNTEITNINAIQLMGDTTSSINRNKPALTSSVGHNDNNTSSIDTNKPASQSSVGYSQRQKSSIASPSSGILQLLGIDVDKNTMNRLFFSLPPIPQQWSCTQCTFINQPDSNNCFICNTTKPVCYDNISPN